MPSSAGERGERAAEKELRRRGMTLLERNVRSAGGEIDLVALDEETIVFVEVKARSSDQFGTPEEAVDRRKRRTLMRAAGAFLRSKGLPEARRRFDVAAVELDPSGRPGDIRWTKGAFDEGDR